MILLSTSLSRQKNGLSESEAQSTGGKLWNGINFREEKQQCAAAETTTRISLPTKIENPNMNGERERESPSEAECHCVATYS